MVSRKLIVLSFGLWFVSAAAASATDHLSNSLALVFDDGAGNTLPYRLFLPPGYDEPEADFPLVLFLHGAGEIGTDNLAQVSSHINGLINATRGEEYPAFLLAPQVQPGQGGWSQLWHPTSLAPAMDLTLQLIDQLEGQYAIDTSKRYVTGLSMGGFGTWDVAAKRPGMFAAAVPMSGGGDPGKAEGLRDVRIWNFHGNADGIVEPEASREMIEAIEEVGGSPLYIETSGGHAIWEPIYNDPDGELYDWMFDGVQPPLATFNYNPANGVVSIDADSAPGGIISSFLIFNRSNNFTLRPTMTVDGQVMSTDEFLSGASGRGLVYDGAATGGFRGTANFGPILPPGLDMQTLYDALSRHNYTSPNTLTNDRTFRIVLAVPEPSAMVLVFIGAGGLLAARRRVREPWKM